ncbi:MAG TPA: hypothetical protein VE569_00885 [Acidimicrobiia bacterium]|nr:hypothetical protein [Acidimicrobiia bacterium]
MIGVTSVAESKASPAIHDSGRRLFEIADLVIDIGTPVGDALVRLDGFWQTLANVTVVNEIKVRTAELLVRSGDTPPVLTSASLVGSEESQRLFENAYTEYAR